MMQERWVVAAKKADFYAIGEKFGIDPVIARVIRNRGVLAPEEIQAYLHGSMRDISDSHLLKDIDLAAGILSEKIQEQKKICIIGDYDIDGVQATYILWEGIERLGGQVSAMIPDRIRDGYGVNEQLVAQARKDGADTILTCDNGIAASKELRFAKEAGLTVIVTDHHEVPFAIENGIKIEKLPDVDAIVNPRQRDCAYPFKELCGATVAWHLIRVLYEKMGRPVEEADAFIENAAFATVGDVMDLRGENRILVKEGLRRLSQTNNPGMRALIQEKGLDTKKISAYHIGFVLGPCMNASGRLDTAKKALMLLKSKEKREAATLARNLADFNEERKRLTEQGLADAIADIEGHGRLEDVVLVSYLPDCHESIAGIIAGRIRERYHRPAYILTRGREGVKGSGRSIEAYSMYEELCKCEDLLDKFGGHPMAAGCSMPEKNVDTFRKRLNDCATLTHEDLVPKITIDVPMPLDYIRRDLVTQLQILEPFGKGNEKPVFADKNLAFRSPRLVGKGGNVAKVTLVSASGQTYDGVYFGDAKTFLQFLQRKGSGISIIYYPQLNVFRGEENLEIVIQHYC